MFKESRLSEPFPQAAVRKPVHKAGGLHADRTCNRAGLGEDYGCAYARAGGDSVLRELEVVRSGITDLNR